MKKPLLHAIVFLLITAGISACSLNRNAHSDRAFGGGFAETGKKAKSETGEVTADKHTSESPTEVPEVLAESGIDEAVSKPSRSRSSVFTKLSKSPLEKEFRPFHDTTAKKAMKTKSGKPVERNSMWSLILTLGGIFIIPIVPLIPAVILGIIGLVKYRENRELYDPSSTTYAIVGISLSLFFLLLFAAYIFLMVFLIGFV